MSRAYTPALVPAVDVAPDAPALIHDGGTLSWRGLLRRAHDAGRALTAHGVGPHDRVAVHVENTPALVPALYGIWLEGAVAVLLHPRLPPDKARGRAESLGATRLIVDEARERGHPLELPLAALGADLAVESGDDVTGLGAASPRLPAGQWLDVVFTSGSTGRPKAAVHSLGNQLASAEGANAHIPFGPGDRWLVSLPLCHVGGLALLFRAALHGGALAFPRRGEPLADAIARLRITHVSVVAPQLSDLVEAGLDEASRARLKVVLAGGGPFPRPLLERALAGGLPVAQTYGMTEMCSQVTTSAPGAPFSAGRALQLRELKIDDGGEICVRGLPLFLGYTDGATLARPLDDEGFYRTGDLGALDEDGGLVVVGRKDNLFISGGENIHPEEIEAALLEHPDVALAVVVPVPDSRWGSRPVAFVKMREGASRDDDVLRAFLAARLSRFAVPDAFFAWEDTGGLKPNRPRLVEIARAALGDSTDG